jgi:hypothetical protein
MEYEFGPHLAAITRCDLGRVIELNLDDHQYVSAPYPPKPLTQEEVRERGLQTSMRYLSETPTLKIETTTVDTRERKTIFGHLARHIVTTSKRIPLEGSQSQPSETVTDGWYIDLDARTACDQMWLGGTHGHTFLAAGDKPRAKPTFVDIGIRETGFPIQLKTTSRTVTVLADGTRKQSSSVSEMLVSQLEEHSLDPALFEAAVGFHHVDRVDHNPPVSIAHSPSTWATIKEWISNLFQ